MLKAKLLAMCVCPALLAPPAILAVHKPARHAVAHLLHHAAERLDQAPPPMVAAVDCLPVVAGGGPGVPGVGEVALPAGLLAPIGGYNGEPGFYPATYTGGPGGGFVGGGPGSFSGGDGGGGGGVPGTTSGGSPGTGISPVTPSGTSPAPGSTPVTPVTPGLPITNGGTPSATVPEPAAWLLMVVGFGAIGIAVRTRRPTLA